MTSPKLRSASPAVRHASAIAFLAGVTLLFFSGLVIGRTYSEVARYERIVFPWGNPAALATSPRIIHYDQAKSYYPWQVFINNALRDGVVPLWNPYSFGGTPFLAANANNVLYPPRVALSLVASPTRVHDLLASTHMFIAGVTMYVLLLYLGATIGAALLAGVAWMASSFMIAWLALEHFVVVAALLPLALLLVDITLRRRSWAAAVGAGTVLALLFLGGNVLFVELCFLVLALYGIGVLVATARRRGSSLIDVGRFVAVWLVCAGLSAITLLPTVQLSREIARSPLSYSDLTDLALPWGSLVNFLKAPSLNEPSFLRDPYHAALFSGTAVALLAVVGLGARRRGAWFARLVALGALLVALGTPVLALPYFVLPGFDNFKPLGRVLFLFAFGVAILAGFGLDAVLTWIRARAWTRGAASIAVPVVLAVAIGTTILQLRVYAGAVMHTQRADAADLYPRTPLIDELAKAPGARFYPVGGVLPGSTPLVYSARSALGYESIVAGRTQDFWRVVSGVPVNALSKQPVASAFELAPNLGDTRIDLLRRSGVRFVVAPPNTSSVAGALMPVYSGRDGMIFRLRGVTPRAYVVPRCVAVHDARAALASFQKPAFDPRRAVIVEGDARDCGNETAAQGSAEIVRDGTQRLVIRTKTSGPAFLVLNDTWDPGWKATVDGRSTHVFAANALFRAVRVDGGSHVVVFRYAPTSYAVGVWITVATAVISLASISALAFRSRYARPRNAAS